MSDTITTAREFFENVIKIMGENQLYRMIYGELPTDEDAEIRIRKQMQMAKDAKPLMDELNKAIEEMNND